MANQNSTKTVISTVRELNALKPKDREYEVRDEGSPGLRLRISPQGRMTWFHRYASPYTGKTVKLTLGQFYKIKPSEPMRGMGLAEARAEWNDNRVLLLQRIDPKRDRKARREREREQERQSQTQAAASVEKLVQDYVVSISDVKKSWQEDQRILSKYLAAKYGTLSAYELTRGDIRDVLDSLRAQNKAVQANRTLASIRSMFNWALRNDWPTEKHPIESNPCNGLKVTKERPRDRALNDAELQQLLRNLPNHLTSQTSDILLFILATGCRIGEAAELKFEHIVGDEWRQPPGKNGYAQTVYLSDFALDILKRQISNNGFVWPNDETSKGHIRSDSVAKELAAVVDKLKIEKFTAHDLRRTLATWLGNNQVDERIHDRILNHHTGGIRRVYNVASYNKPARQCWRDWGQHLQTLGTNGDERARKPK